MKRVCVILSAYNGERYLREQVESILAQTGVEVTLLIRDDGSQDGTPGIMKDIQAIRSNVRCVYGENIGFRRSFYDMLLAADDTYDYYAFSDQDDVWDADKLSHAVELLEQTEGSVRLYASGLRVVDENLRFMYNNSFPGLRTDYGAALSRQRIAGCTMVFDRGLTAQCRRFRITPEMGHLFSHDAAVYYICLACGGQVVFDPESRISFRRHIGTVTEHGKGFWTRVESVTNVFGRFRDRRYHQVKELLKVYAGDMPSDVYELSRKIAGYRDSIGQTLALAGDRRIRCGIRSADIINWVAVLCRCY